MIPRTRLQGRVNTGTSQRALSIGWDVTSSLQPFPSFLLASLSSKERERDRLARISRDNGLGGPSFVDVLDEFEKGERKSLRE